MISNERIQIELPSLYEKSPPESARSNIGPEQLGGI
jgi:hypothetical protein